MLETITSKLIFVIVIFVIIGGIVGFYVVERRNINERELENIANSIVKYITEVSVINGNISVEVVYENRKGAFYIPPTVENTHYKILLTENTVFVEWENIRVGKSLSSKIYLWKPTRDAYKTSEIDHLKSVYWRLEILSGEIFMIARKKIDVNSNTVFYTFVYKQK